MTQNHPEYIELSKKYFSESKYLYDLELIKKPPKDYIKTFFENLAKHQRYNQLKDDFIYDAEMDVFIQIHNRFPISEVEDLSEEEFFFYSFMSKKEIKQIFNINSSEDYLLRLRAEQVESNSRLKRTFSKLKKTLGDRWSFTNFFESNQYKKYLKNLNSKHRPLCVNIPHGTIHSNEPNGMCFKTEFGNIIVLSYTLRHFLYYMNIFHFGKQFGIRDIDVFHAFLLAIRIMIGTESLDFEIDTRGRLPRSVKKKIDFLTDCQMSFIIGHEYAHHYLGHLQETNILKSTDRIYNLSDKVKRYNYKQNCEFEADSHSISETTYEEHAKANLLDGAFLLFSYLEMYDNVENYLFPKINYSRTHPNPLERIWKLRSSIDENIGLTENHLNLIVNNNKAFLDFFLKEYLPYNVEAIETVGSIYLPSYKKKVLIDRLDM